MCGMNSVLGAIGTLLLCCDLATGYVLAPDLSTRYLTDQRPSDMDSPSLPMLYQVLRSYPDTNPGDKDDDDSRFEGLFNFSRRGSIRLSVDDTGGFDVMKRLAPPAREWCRIIGYKICRRSLS